MQRIGLRIFVNTTSAVQCAVDIDGLTCKNWVQNDRQGCVGVDLGKFSAVPNLDSIENINIYKD